MAPTPAALEATTMNGEHFIVTKGHDEPRAGVGARHLGYAAGIRSLEQDHRAGRHRRRDRLSGITNEAITYRSTAARQRHHHLNANAGAAMIKGGSGDDHITAGPARHDLRRRQRHDRRGRATISCSRRRQDGEDG